MLFPTFALTTAADAVGDVFVAGLRVENDAGPRIRATTTGAVSSNTGLSFNSTGRLVYVDATAGLPGNTVFANGWPTSSGALCISTNSPVTYSNGIPFAATGAVSVTVTA